MREETLERVGNSGRVADFGKDLGEFGVNADAARAFMQKLKSKLAARGRLLIIETFARGCEPNYRPATAPLVIKIDTS